MTVDNDGKCLIGIDGIKMGRLFESVENIESSMANIKESNSKEHSEIIEYQKKQNGRIGQLENWKWYIMGIFGTILIILRFWGDLVKL